MKRILLAAVALVVLSGHDMYLKLDAYFLPPNTPARIVLFNGTFDQSTNSIDRVRMLDASLLGNGKRTPVDTAQWTDLVTTTDTATLLQFTTGDAGTYVAGVSTRARNIAMEAEAFNNYLAHDGVLDMISLREEEKTAGDDAVEKYSKHVKVIFQVGDRRTEDWQTVLGYPIEFVPLSNPYDLHAGDEFAARLLRDGKPMANQLVYADHKAAEDGHSHGGEHEHAHDGEHEHDGDSGQEHSHDQADASGHTHAEGDDHQHTTGAQLRTDDDGVIRFPVTADGEWYLRTIHLVKSEEVGLTHESNWATLTFGVDHGQPHAHASDSADQDHDDEGGIPLYVFLLGSIAVVGGLFFYFNRRS